MTSNNHCAMGENPERGNRLTNAIFTYSHSHNFIFFIMPLGIYLLILILIILVLMINHQMRKKSGAYDIYIIHRFRHYSRKNGFLLPFKFGFAKKTLRFIGVFAEGCDYKDKSDGDINKLYGISYGFDNHWRSVRIGWRWNENLKVIELFTYAYVKGKRQYKFLTCVALYDEITYTIFKEEKESIVRIKVENDKGKIIASDEVIGIDYGWLRLREYPYMGGDTVQERDVKIIIKEL